MKQLLAPKLISDKGRDAVIAYLKAKPLRQLAQITCKNEGCNNKRRNGSKFCQDCSDKHHAKEKTDI